MLHEHNFFSLTDAQRYIKDVIVIKCLPEYILYISACELIYDIPDEWLQV